MYILYIYISIISIICICICIYIYMNICICVQFYVSIVTVSQQRVHDQQLNTWVACRTCFQLRTSRDAL